VKAGDSLHSAVASLQKFLNQSADAGAKTPEGVRQQAKDTSFPYPELAAQVFSFLQTNKTSVEKGLNQEDISEAFMALLLDSSALEALGAGKAKNPWRAVRDLIQRTGQNLGTSMLEVYSVVRKTGLGYTPTILEMSAQISGMLAALAKGEVPEGQFPQMLAQMAAEQGIPGWVVALIVVWKRRKKGWQVGDDPPTDEELEELLSDPELFKELKAESPDGPWDVYKAQAEQLRMLRHFGHSLIALSDA